MNTTTDADYRAAKDEYAAAFDEYVAAKVEHEAVHARARALQVVRAQAWSRASKAEAALKKAAIASYTERHTSEDSD